MTGPTEPTYDELICFFNKTVSNAHQLIEDAKLLLDNLKFARASFLSQIACEELAKSILILRNAVDSRNGIPINYRNLIKNTRDHKIKTSIYLGLFNTILNSEIETITLKHMSSEINNNKNASLYADYYTNLSAFKEPSELFTGDDAKVVYSMATSLVKAVQFYKDEYLTP